MLLLNLNLNFISKQHEIKFALKKIYLKIVFYSTEKHKMHKYLGAFWNQLVLYEIKLIF